MYILYHHLISGIEDVTLTEVDNNTSSDKAGDKEQKLEFRPDLSSI